MTGTGASPRSVGLSDAVLVMHSPYCKYPNTAPRLGAFKQVTSMLQAESGVCSPGYHAAGGQESSVPRALGRCVNSGRQYAGSTGHITACKG